MLLKTSLRNFLAHKGRMVLSLIAVVLSVAFVSGTLVFSNTATSTFDKLFDATASDLSVSSAPAKGGDQAQQNGGKTLTVPAAAVARITGQPGVKSAQGQVSVETGTLVNPRTNKAVGPTGGAPTIVGAWVPGPRPAMTITSGSAPAGPKQLMIDADTAKHAGLHVGDPMRVIGDQGTFDYTVSGIATFNGTNPGAALAFLDVPTAQQDLLGDTAGYTSIEVYGDGSKSDDQLKTEVADALGSGYQFKTAAEQKADGQKSIGSFLNFMKYVMLGFAGVSLLVGAFLIINTFSMLVAQRTREIGLLRALGGSRRQVNRSVLIEALLLGVIGSTLGMLAGLGLAQLLIQLMKAAGMNLSSSLVIGANVPVASYLVGIVITVLAAWIPARRAGKVSPMAALRDHGTPSEGAANRVRMALGLLVTAGGGALLAAGAASKALGTGGSDLGLGLVLTLVGFVVLGPLLAGVVIRVLGVALPTLFGPAGRLAQRNALRNPRRTGATAAALMIGLALVTGASVVTSSMVSSTSSQIDKSVGADYIVTVNHGGLTAAMVNAAKGTTGLAHVTEQRMLPATFTTPDGKHLDEFVSAVSPTFTQDFSLPVSSGSTEGLASGGISIDQNFAKDNNLKAGDKLAIDYGKGRTQTLPIAVVTSTGNTIFDRHFFATIDTVAQAVPLDQQPTDELVFGKAAAGVDVEKTLTALQNSLTAYPQVTVQDQAGYKKIVQQSVDGLLHLVYGLLGLAITVAVLGVVNTLALSVVERTREIGLLRAIGLSRRQLRRMIRLESVVIAVFGAILGTGLGLAWGVTAQRVLRNSGLNDLSIPVTTIVVVLLASAVVGLLAALLPAFRAGRMNVLAAIATD
ncbi:ABC transporter permease [Kitasatospora kifunensis]|uniref:Putative ABC transport system permease protein n=1 Tax=Kitasatospora kifunensis TaxID=58351 RepID=A0A7W7R4Q1_KITKI|nr:FtsX-like permease family protein [Kitasatospora kifunensis]MBB4925390.1 putative ABC transport system permease protein [Kitasatospora kifunensis]